MSNPNIECFPVNEDIRCCNACVKKEAVSKVIINNTTITLCSECLCILKETISSFVLPDENKHHNMLHEIIKWSENSDPKK